MTAILYRGGQVIAQRSTVPQDAPRVLPNRDFKGLNNMGEQQLVERDWYTGSKLVEVNAAYNPEYQSRTIQSAVLAGDVLTVTYAVTDTSLAEFKVSAELAVDEEAGNARKRYITDAPGQEATYLVKEEEARAYKAVGYTGTVPMYVQAEANSMSSTAQVAADTIIAMADSWRVLGSTIEQTRRTYKYQIENATTHDQVIAARDAGKAALALI